MKTCWLQQNLYAFFHLNFNMLGRWNSEINEIPLEIHNKFQEYGEKMAMFQFSVLVIQNL